MSSLKKYILAGCLGCLFGIINNLMLVANLTVYKFIYLLFLLTFCGFVCSTIFDYVSVHNSIAKSIQYHIFDWKSHKYCTFILKKNNQM